MEALIVIAFTAIGIGIGLLVGNVLGSIFFSKECTEDKTGTGATLSGIIAATSKHLSLIHI